MSCLRYDVKRSDPWRKQIVLSQHTPLPSGPHLLSSLQRVEDHHTMTRLELGAGPGAPDDDGVHYRAAILQP